MKKNSLKRLIIKTALSLLLFALPLTSFSYPMVIDLRSFWVSPGVNVAYAGGDQSHIQIGGELSAFYFSPLFFYGVYGDYQYNKDRNYFTVGPEIGVYTGIVNGGIDGGVIFPMNGDKSKGFTVRVFFSVLTYPVMPYFRYNHFVNSKDTIEVGMLFKIPLQIK